MDIDSGIRIGDTIHPRLSCDFILNDPDGLPWYISEDDCDQNWLEQPAAPEEAGADVRGTTALPFIARFGTRWQSQRIAYP